MKTAKLSVALALACGLCAGKTMLYLGAWPNQLIVIDEGTYQVVKRIELKTDVPRNLVLTPDRTKLIVTTLKDTGIETIDVAKGDVADSFTLGDHNTRVWIAGVAVDPAGKYLYANVTTSKKLIDRWEIGTAKLSVIDLAQHKIIRQADIPAASRQMGFRGGGYRVSPDGKLLYQFGHSIDIYDTATLKKVQTIELQKTTFPDMENLTFAPEFDPNDDADTLTGIFNSEDPEVHRRIVGIATFHLNERKFDFTPIGPAEQEVSNIRYTPDHKHAYAVAITGLHGDRHCEFWGIDIANSKLVQRHEFACRPRFSFSTSSNGNDLYIYAAGFELEVYDAATMNLQKTLNVDADITTQMVTVVGDEGARASK